MLTSCISTFYAFLVIIISLFDCGGYIQLHGCERGGILYKHCRKDCGLMPRWRQQDKKLRGMLRHFCWLLMECLLCCAAAELFFNVCPKGLICFHVRAKYANAPQQHCVLTPMHLSDSSFLFPLLLIALSQQKLANAGLQIRPGSDKLRFWTCRNLEFFPWVSVTKLKGYKFLTKLLSLRKKLSFFMQLT